jgi:hypothetical protein
VLRSIKRILWPSTPPPNGAVVRRRLKRLLSRLLDHAPKRGKGARHRRFLRHVRDVEERYGERLYHCYDDPRIPQTTNEIEGLHGILKRHLRKATARNWNFGGPTESAAEFLVPALHAVRCGSAFELVDPVTPALYKAARTRLEQHSARARRYRSIQRDPSAHLERVLAECCGV